MIDHNLTEESSNRSGQKGNSQVNHIEENVNHGSGVRNTMRDQSFNDVDKGNKTLGSVWFSGNAFLTFMNRLKGREEGIVDNRTEIESIKLDNRKGTTLAEERTIDTDLGTSQKGTVEASRQVQTTLICRKSCCKWTS